MDCHPPAGHYTLPDSSQQQLKTASTQHQQLHKTQHNTEQQPNSGRPTSAAGHEHRSYCTNPSSGPQRITQHKSTPSDLHHKNDTSPHGKNRLLTHHIQLTRTATQQAGRDSLSTSNQHNSSQETHTPDPRSTPSTAIQS